MRLLGHFLYLSVSWAFISNPVVPLRRSVAKNRRQLECNIELKESQGSGETKTVVYLVDDDPQILSALTMYLETETRYCPVTFTSPPPLLKELSGGNVPACVISDIRMPESPLDGLELVKAIRTDPSNKISNLPIILLTAKGMTPDRILGYKAGADAYLPKPFDPDELVAIIDGLIRRKSNSGETGDMNDIRSELSAIKNMLAAGGVPSAVDKDAASVALSPRETEVLDYLAAGLTNKEIAGRMDLSTRTIERHVQNMFIKTGAENRTGLLAWGYEAGVINRRR